MENNTLKIGLALSGGGARGIAHIGVLQALEENGIYPTALAGASAGAVVGALYAAGLAPSEILDFVKDSKLWRIFRIGLPTDGLARLGYLRERLTGMIRADDFSALEKPLFVSVTNLNLGTPEIRSEGTLLDSILASCSIPLIFKPIELNGQIYVDGGVLNNLPASPLREICDTVIGVNLVPHLVAPSGSLQNALSIAVRTFELSIVANSLPGVRHCDIVLEPCSMRSYHMFQFNKYQEIYAAGYQTATAAIGQIKALIAEGAKVNSPGSSGTL
ncbi:MAG: patatin-like phospholipase family protein [Saprospiraceae bacterium]|jgi:NTE family protein